MELVIVGVDVGQKVDPTAIVVAEAVRRERTPARGWTLPRGLGALNLVTGEQVRYAPAEVETVFVARHLERLPLGTGYPAVAARVAGVCRNLHERWKGQARPFPGRWLFVNVDATGVGAPVVELVQAAVAGLPLVLTAATFTHGDRVEGRYGDRAGMRVGKAHLVSRLQVLFQTGRVELPQDHPEAAAMLRELLDYEIRIDDDAHDRYGAFRVGAHDDLVTALGLAVLAEPWAERDRGSVRTW